MIRLTEKGKRCTPEVAHHFPAWGGIKELLRVRGGAATREEILEILSYVGHHSPNHDPNTAYLNYAIKQGWLVED